MTKELTQEEVYVREQLTKLYPQLLINCQKTLGAAYDKYGGDLIAVAVEFFLNKPIEVQVKAFKEGRAENFITFIMAMQSKSSTSKWYHEYRKFHEKQREYFTESYLYSSEDKEDEDDDRMLCIKQAIKQLNPYEKMLVECKVLKGMKFTEIEEYYDIPYSSLASELKKTLNKIKKQCQHLQYLV